jgi:hypothetical protein
VLAGHPWIRNYNDVKVPLDILIFKLMKTYMRSSSLRKAALRVSILVSKYTRMQFVMKITVFGF